MYNVHSLMQNSSKAKQVYNARYLNHGCLGIWTQETGRGDSKGYEESGAEASVHYVNGGSSLTGTKVLKLTQIYLVSTGNLLYACIIFQWSFLLLLIGIKSRAPHLLGEHWAASAFFSLLLLRQGHTK